MNARIQIVTACLGLVTALICTVTACTTSDGDAGRLNSSTDRASTTLATRPGPPVPVDAAAPDDLVPQLPVILTVDGQIFTITERDGGHDYTWDTGPNPGYGFSESAPMTAQVPEQDATRIRPTPPPSNTLSHYRASIRDFLDAIDPNTGYLEE
ncbi:hypothetical protein [Williamsia sp. 1138]|uniref:hypothetical protein n=1 Tax=Williamsia sp. 1138 TaxID=1903117 RepID=UPI001AEFB549|nr:hypothetical protein [Williamsia sp. 1138]